MIKTLKRLTAVGVIASAALGMQTAHAVSADTTIEIDFPTILVLYHFDTINLSVSEANLATALGASTSSTSCTAGTGEYCVEVTGPVGLALDLATPTVDANMNDTIGPLTPLGTVSVEIDNAWGVRSIGAAAGLQASVTGNDLVQGAETIPVSNDTTNDTNPAVGLTMATGDIAFDMDLSNLDTSGTYAGDFTITVVSL